MIRTLLVLLTSLSIYAPTTVVADEITLTSFDKTVRFTGVFAGFRQDVYVINYNGHLIELPAALMTCEGDSCIAITPQTKEPAG